MEPKIVNQLEIRAEDDDLNGVIRLWVVAVSGRGEIVGVAPQLPTREFKGDESPTLTISYPAAEDLMTRLWRLGVRPCGVAQLEAAPGLAAEVPIDPLVEALREHIRDLRRVAFGPSAG